MAIRLSLSPGHMPSWVSVSPPGLSFSGRKGRLLMIDTFISKTTRLYKDSRALTQGSGSNPKPNQLDQLNENLQDVTRIMTKNMEDLLWRGDSLDRESVSHDFPPSFSFPPSLCYSAPQISYWADTRNMLT